MLQVHTPRLLKINPLRQSRINTLPLLHNKPSLRYSSHKKPPLQLQPNLPRVTPSHMVYNKVPYHMLPLLLNSPTSSKAKHPLRINTNLLYSNLKKLPLWLHHYLTKVTPTCLVNNKVLYHSPCLLLNKSISNKVMALLSLNLSIASLLSVPKLLMPLKFLLIRDLNKKDLIPHLEPTTISKPVSHHAGLRQIRNLNFTLVHLQALHNLRLCQKAPLHSLHSQMYSTPRAQTTQGL